MWAQAGFEPDAFWAQTPRHFQLAMRGVRKRLEIDSETRTQQAWETGAFGAAAQAGKLKALSHYLRKPGRRQTPQEMLAVMRSFQSKGAKMSIKRIRMDSR
jgi:hypothetical protein